jgi:hypothetical protein
MATAAARRDYELTVRQEPKQARMCGVGGKSQTSLPGVTNITYRVAIN